MPSSQTGWPDGSAGGSGGSTMIIETETGAAYSLTNFDLAGSRLKVMTSASAITFTVPAGLAGTEPVTIAQYGSGVITFAPAVGVNVYSKDALLSTGGQYASVTLIPIAADEYWLVGALA